MLREKELSKKEQEDERGLALWDPFREMWGLRTGLSRMVDEMLAGRFPRMRSSELEAGRAFLPPVDIEESDGEYVVKAELPGVEKSDVKVEIEDGMLVLRGERKEEKEEKGKNYLRREQSYGSFYRSLALPEAVDQSKVKAEYKNGVLTIHIPRSETEKSRKVQVQIQ